MVVLPYIGPMEKLKFQFSLSELYILLAVELTSNYFYSHQNHPH